MAHIPLSPYLLSKVYIVLRITVYKTYVAILETMCTLYFPPNDGLHLCVGLNFLHQGLLAEPPSLPLEGCETGCFPTALVNNCLIMDGTYFVGRDLGFTAACFNLPTESIDYIFYPLAFFLILFLSLPFPHLNPCCFEVFSPSLGQLGQDI